MFSRTLLHFYDNRWDQMRGNIFSLLWRSGGTAAAPLTGGGLCVSSLKSTTLNPSCLLLNGPQGLCCQATVVVGGGVVDSVSSRMDTRRRTLPDSGTRVASVIAGCKRVEDVRTAALQPPPSHTSGDPNGHFRAVEPVSRFFFFFSTKGKSFAHSCHFDFHHLAPYEL